MKNIWTQHLERSNTGDHDKGTSFNRMLHSLVRTGVDADNSAGTALFLPDNESSGNSSYFINEDVGSLKGDERAAISKNDVDVSYAAETEIIAWAAKSQKGHELGIDSLSDDHVRLLMAEDGKLFLRYDVAGERPFEMNVKSENEARQIIEEDNVTTEQLYPENPELKWIKITLI